MAEDFTTPKSGLDTSKPLTDQFEQVQAILDSETSAPPAEEEGSSTLDLNPDHDPEAGAPSNEELSITEEMKTAYFESILAGGLFVDVADLFDGKIKVGLRARTSGESEECLISAGQQGSDTVVDYELHLTLRFLSYSLVYVQNTRDGRKGEYDHGTLDERIERLRALPGPLYTSLIEVANRFDRRLARLSHLSTLPNFWQTADAS